MSHPYRHCDIQIDYLANHVEHLSTVAQWHQNQWSYLTPTVTLSMRTERLIMNSQKGGVPTTYLALSNGQPVACASLVSNDMSIRGTLSPWLASVFVLPSCRNEGVGSKLVNHVMQEARSLGIPVMYLYTPDRQSFYARLGWSERETCDYRGFTMTVMQRDLQASED